MAWTKVAHVNDVPIGKMMQVCVDEDDIALYHLLEGFYATSDVCTHASQSLVAGKLDGHIVACPKHGGKFDVITGAPTAFPCVIPLRTYALEVRGEEIWIEVD